MNLRTRLIICLLLFVTAFFVRWGSSMDVLDKPGRQVPTYQTLGTGGDPDYQLYCARELSGGGPGGTETWTHYDYLFLCPAMSLVVKHFSLISSFEIFAYASMVFGSLAVVMPFAVFSTVKKHDLGGLLASLVLLVNPVMINNSDGRFYNYPLVVFFFTLFAASYVLALYRKSLFWLVLTGVIAVVQGISKPFLYVNDMALMVIFPVFFCLKSWRFTKKFPYVSFDFDWWLLRRATFPTQIYFIGIIGFEILHHFVTYKTNGFFYLTDLFFRPTGGSTKDAVLGLSLHFEGGILQKTKNILSLGIIALQTLIAYIPQTWTVLLLATGSIILRTKKPLLWLIASAAVVKALSYLVLFVTNTLLYPNIYVPLERATAETAMTAALFICFLVLLAIHTKKGLLFVAMHIFYFAGLAMALGAVRQPQLFVTLIIWFSLMVGYAVNVYWPDFVRTMTTRIQLVFMAIILVFFLTPLNENLSTVQENWDRTQKEKIYLSWVDKNIPENAIILGGIDDSLPLISRITDRTIIYNARYVSHFVPPGGKVHDLYQVKFLSIYIREQLASSSGIPLYFLDNYTDAWVELLEKGASGNYPAGWFRLEEAAYNSDLNRRVYRLVAKDLPLTDTP